MKPYFHRFSVGLFHHTDALTVTTLLTRGVLMHQEGKDEVFIDVMTVLQIIIHVTHMFAELCNTGKSRIKIEKK